MATENTKKYKKDYQKKHIKIYGVSCQDITDYDIIEIMQNIQNKSEFIKSAIRFYAAQNPEKIK